MNNTRGTVGAKAPGLGEGHRGGQLVSGRRPRSLATGKLEFVAGFSAHAKYGDVDLVAREDQHINVVNGRPGGTGCARAARAAAALAGRAARSAEGRAARVDPSPQACIQKDGAALRTFSDHEPVRNAESVIIQVANTRDRTEGEQEGLSALTSSRWNIDLVAEDSGLRLVGGSVGRRANTRRGYVGAKDLACRARRGADPSAGTALSLRRRARRARSIRRAVGRLRVLRYRAARAVRVFRALRARGARPV